MPCMAAAVLAIDPPRTPNTIPGRSPSGLHRTGRHCFARSTKHREVFGESHEGWAASYYVLIRTAFEADFLAYMGDSVE